MLTHLFHLSLLSLLPADPAALSPGSPAPVTSVRPCQDETPDERADVAMRLKDFRALLKKKGEKDLEAIALIDGFTREFEDYGPKDRKAVVKALDGALKVKRRDLEEGVPDNRLYVASVVALGEMAPESVDSLLSWLGHKSHRRNVVLQVRIVTAVGKTMEPDAIDPLVDLLTDKEKKLQAAAARALANFDTEPLEERKKIFKELLDVLMAQKAAKDADVKDLEAFERWSTISGPIKDTLQALSGHDEREAEGWQRWWNKNKKKDWDES